MTCLKKPSPPPVCAPPPRSRPLPPLSSNETLALWTQASHLFHHLNWTSAALQVAQILRRTSSDSTSHISRAKLWANLCVVRFHLGDYCLALQAIQEALEEVSVSMGLSPGAVDDENFRGGAALRLRLGRARSVTTTFTDFVRAGASSLTSPSRRIQPKRISVFELPGANRTRTKEETTTPRRVGKAATVANSITTMGRFIRAGAVWSVGNSGTADIRRVRGRKETRKLTPNTSLQATETSSCERPEFDILKSTEATCPEETSVEARKIAKRRLWNPQARTGQSPNGQREAKDERHASSCRPRPLTPSRKPLPFPPETPLLFFLAGLVAYHLPTSPHSPINYFRVAHSYFKRCLRALSLISRATNSRAPSSQHTTEPAAGPIAEDDDDSETFDYDFAGEGVNNRLEYEQVDEQANGFDFSPYGFAFVLSRRSVITNALTCDYEAECVEGRGTLVVGRCRGVDGLGTGVEGVWFEAPLE